MANSCAKMCLELKILKEFQEIMKILTSYKIELPPYGSDDKGKVLTVKCFV